MPKKKAARAVAKKTSSGIEQQVRAGDQAVMDNVATSEAEAKDHFGGDHLALWNALRENRWGRKRKLLPNLRLTYPSDSESRHIAALARVDNASLFSEHIQSIILDAHLDHASFLTRSIPQVKKVLKGVASQATLLGKTLSKLDVGRGSKGSEEYAGYLIELELASNERVTSRSRRGNNRLLKGGMVLLPEYIDLLNALSNICRRVAQGPMHLEKGAGGNPAFDRFIRNLLMGARMCGGSWTNYKSKDQTWKGTLLDALKILEKYLPQQQFFPPGEIGRSVDHIKEKLWNHIKREPDES